MGKGDSSNRHSSDKFVAKANGHPKMLQNKEGPKIQKSLGIFQESLLANCDGNIKHEGNADNNGNLNQEFKCIIQKNTNRLTCNFETRMLDGNSIFSPKTTRNSKNMQKFEIHYGEKAEKEKGENVHGTQESEEYNANEDCDNEKSKNDQYVGDSTVGFVRNGNRECFRLSSNIINLKNEAKGFESVKEEWNEENEEYNKANVCQQPAASVSDSKETKLILTDAAAEQCTMFTGEDAPEGSRGNSVKKEHRHCLVRLGHDLFAGKNSSSEAIKISRENTDQNADQFCEGKFSSRYSLYDDLKTLHQKMCYELETTDEPASLKNFFLERVEFAARQVVVLNPFLHEELRGQPKEESWRYEVIRLASFSHLNGLAASAIRLAMSGFYYDEEIDEIKCFSCGVFKRHWERSEAPSIVHLEISPKCKHANFQDATNVPIQTKNYTLLEASTAAQSMQGTLQQTTDDGRSTAPSSMLMTDSGFDSAADSLESREPMSTLEKSQTHLDNHANERSDALSGSSSQVPCLKGATTAISSFSSKAGLEGYTEPPGASSEKSSHYNGGPPPVCQVYTTLMSHNGTPNLEGKRFPVQAQQPAVVSYPYPRPESGRPEGTWYSMEVIPEPLTPGLDMLLAASPMNSKVMTRLVSFANSWSTLTTGQSPKDLAVAGFFYLGVGDSVRCFYCAITLREWKHGDDPWEVHVLARFSCAYVKAVKGEDFIVQTLILHSRKHNSLSAGNGQARLQTSTSSLEHHSSSGNYRGNKQDAPSVQTPSGSGQSALGAKPAMEADRSSANSAQAAQTASSTESVTSSASATMMQGEKVGTNLVPSPDVREKVRTSGDLQMDCADTDRRGSNLSLSSSTKGGASVAGSQPSTNRLTALNPDPDADLQRLVETNRRLRERRTCRLCRQRTVDTIFLPCGHICTCESCAKSIKICVLCHQSIRGTAHVYLD